ncbi:MAG: PD-(D/E)XK nuclease domain-containing protein [Lachnospiraceae bacterium]|nr:PD-(D/E)XK nuclease domain-containing protein [Lachnospiraceae bacterium]
MVRILDAQYVILSNRESGLGRYDVVLEPKDRNMDAFIMEFKAFDQKRQKYTSTVLVLRESKY